MDKKQLPSGWQLINTQSRHHLEKEFSFKDFKSALAFVNRVGDMAEADDHHPDIFLAWGKVKIQVWTHTKNGVTERDYKFAAKAESLYPAKAL
jgi:4a-hydroxytetrahydrobiopterin dehydratase